MKKLLLPLLALAALALPARAAIDLAAIKPDGFAHGVVFTVDGYAANEDRATLQDFPVLVRISTTRISGFAYTDSLASNGGDLCFKAENGSVLPYEVDTWNTSGESLVWVKLPSMTNGTEFAMFYGAPANAVAAVAAGKPWGDYAGVWHLNETAAGNVSGGVTITDSTDNGLNGTAGNKALSPQYMAGPVGNGRRIYDSDSKEKQGIVVNLNSQAKIDAVYGLGTDFTASFWVYRTGVLKWHFLISAMDGDGYGSWGVQGHDDNADKNFYPEEMRIWANNKDNNSSDRAGISARLTDFTANNGWHKMDVVWKYTTNNNSPSFELYWDGELTTNFRNIPASYGPVNHKNTAIAIGGDTGGKARAFAGYMDEVRLRAFVPTADWIKADYDTVNDTAFLSASAAQEFTVRPIPVIDGDVVDTGAAFLQFAGTVTSCGGTSTLVNVYAKAWPTANPPADPNADWTLLASGVTAGGSFGGFLTGLSPETEYTWALKGVNNLPTPETSDLTTNVLETSGVGDAGSGGVVERKFDEFVHTFLVDERGNTTFTFSPPEGVSEVDALVVAGGGPGGFYAGGGGGAGGLIYTNELVVTGGANYAITVGTGGVASASISAWGSNGGNSSIVGTGVNLVAIGGGAGGNGPLNSQTATGAGQDGGNGGGGHSAGGLGTLGQGNDGGSSGDTPNYGGGGGGADGVGTTLNWGKSATKGGGGGGDGLQVPITGVNVRYAGGGGGGGPKSYSNGSYGSGGPGGIGGGGKGGQDCDTEESRIAENGVDGLGGGGGGGSTFANFQKGGNGGNGVVIIRYGAGGDGDGVVHPTISLTGLTYDDVSGDATVTYRVGWAGDGYDRADVIAIWGYYEDDLDNTNALVSAVIGQGEQSFTLPRVSKTVYVRLLAKNSGNYTGVSPEVKSLVLFNPAAPVATVSASQTLGSGNAGVSKAALTATVTDLGAGATSVNGVFQICSDKFFDSGTYTTFAVTNGPITETGDLKGVATGLIADTTYWVRAVLTNDVLTAGEPTVFETEPVSFTTGACGWPWGRFVPSNDDPTFTVTTDSISAQFTFRGIGEGAVSGSAWMEVSATENFATILASSAVTNVVAADIPATCAFTVTGLQPETAYYVRYRVRNNGGRETSNEKQWAFTTASDTGNMLLLVW